MTGVQVFMVRVDHDDVMVAATGLMEAVDACYRQFLAECDPDDADATREYFDRLLGQVVRVGEVEIFTGGAVAAIVSDEGGS